MPTSVANSVVFQADSPRARLCLVAPCYNEEDALPAFFRQVIPALETLTAGMWQLICVDDGSKDGTFPLIVEQHAKDARVAGIRLSRNFGHQPAVTVGIAFAQADYVAVIDADLQDPVEILAELYQKAVAEDLDVCFGIRGRREAPLFLRFAYSLFYRIINHLSDHDWPRDAGDFCVMSARCQAVLLSLPEHSRMLRGLRAWVGFKQGSVSYHRPARRYGRSKYNLRRLSALALQGLVAFSSVPLRLAGMLGIAGAMFSVLFGILILINRMIPSFTILGYWVGANPGMATILLFGSFIASLLFLCLGIIGEYLNVMFQEIKGRPAAIVEQIVGAVQKNDLASHVNNIATITTWAHKLTAQGR